MKRVRFYDNGLMGNRSLVRGKQQAIKLSKFIGYVLGRHPDEFGLVPDGEGYVKTKELLKALHEESGWRHVRKGHLNEALLTLQKPNFEVVSNRIRAVDRTNLPRHRTAKRPPKLLFTAVRRRAYPVILTKGLRPMDCEYVTLAVNEKMALRMGQRLDQSPVLLTIQVTAALNVGIEFMEFGRNLYLATAIPPQTISGPPLPKEGSEPIRQSRAEHEPKPKTPGSFLLDPQRGIQAKKGDRSKRSRDGRKKEIAWKKERKKRRNKDYKKWP